MALKSQLASTHRRNAVRRAAGESLHGGEQLPHMEGFRQEIGDIVGVIVFAHLALKHAVDGTFAVVPTRGTRAGGP